MPKQVEPYFQVVGGPFDVQKAQLVIPAHDLVIDFACRGIEYELKGGQLGTLTIKPEYFTIEASDGLGD